MEDDNDGFNFSEGFVCEDSDDEKQAPAQPAWAFPDSKREMERELKAAGVTSVDAKIQKARANAKRGAKKGKGKTDDSDISDEDDSDDDSDDALGAQEVVRTGDDEYRQGCEQIIVHGHRSRLISMRSR